MPPLQIGFGKLDILNMKKMLTSLNVTLVYLS